MMTHRFKFFHRWLAMGYGLILLVISLSLTPFPPDIPLPDILKENGDKLGHGMAYAMLMVWFAWLYPNLRTRLGYAAGFVVLGIALEFAQGLTEYRAFELADMSADAVGVALGWITALPPLPNLLVLIERGLLKAV
ncbi:MAG: VanZ family protein [Gammaproteobacteria bacterium]